MYKEEKIINGILCWRSTPDGEFHEYTKEQLTQKIKEAEKDYSELSIKYSKRTWND